VKDQRDRCRQAAALVTTLNWNEVCTVAVPPMPDWFVSPVRCSSASAVRGMMSPARANPSAAAAMGEVRGLHSEGPRTRRARHWYHWRPRANAHVFIERGGIQGSGGGRDERTAQGDRVLKVRRVVSWCSGGSWMQPIKHVAERRRDEDALSAATTVTGLRLFSQLGGSRWGFAAR